MIIGLLIIIVGLGWLLWETKFLTIRLQYGTAIRKMSLGQILKKGIAIIYLAIGLIMLPIRERKPIPAILVSPNGQKYYGFNKNQVDHILRKLPEWNIELENVILKSPSGLVYKIYDGIQSERICRRHLGWEWESK